MSRTIGYLRVSTADQDLEKNKADILKLANEKLLGNVEWVKDWRKRKLGETFDTLKKGDAIIVSELSRLGRFALHTGNNIHCCLN